MNIELIEKLNKFYLDFALGLYIDERIEKNNFCILHSKYIHAMDCNFALDLKVQSRENFDIVWKNIKNEMLNIDRTPTVAIIPIQNFLYKNRNEIFKEKFKLASEEVWLVLSDFKYIDNMKTNCDLKIDLELVNDYNKFAIELLESFKGDENDPYGELESGYIDELSKYQGAQKENFYNEFYFVKYNNEIVGVTANVYNNEIFGIHGLAIKKAYRKKGIGKEVLKKQLQMCRDQNKICFLQTEKGFYPEKLYRKIGFEEACVQYYYQERD